MKNLVTTREIEQVGESLIIKFMGNTSLLKVDIERFIRTFLHLKIIYTNIAEEDVDKIGFLSDGIYPLKIYENGSIIERIYLKGTIVLDRYLLSQDNANKRRFVLAHEAAHVIYERMNPHSPKAAFNRCFDNTREYTVEELQKRFNLCETQVDRLASVLLMPNHLVQAALFHYNGGRNIRVYGNGVLKSCDKLTVASIAESMGVSLRRILSRMSDLGYLEHRDINEYIETEMNFGGGF